MFLITLVAGSGGRAVAADRAEMAAWEAATATNTPAGYYRYLALYPAGDYVEQAIAALTRLRALQPGTRQIPQVPQTPRTGVYP